MISLQNNTRSVYLAILVPFVVAVSISLVAGPRGAEGGILGPSQGMTPRPVCASQYALANYACSMIPYSPLPPPAPPTPPESSSSSRHHHRHSNSARSSRHHRRHHHHHHRSGDDDDDSGSEATPEEEDCCRWLTEMDTDCVCEMLVRLPDFLSRPVHQYTVAVGGTCNVTYACGGRVIRK